MSPIKEKVLSVIQKIVLVFLACLMLIAVIPVGLMPDSEMEYIGNFIRISATEEKYSYSTETKNGVNKISRGACAYLKFNLAQLSETELEDVREVRLRFAFLKGSGSIKNKIEVNVLPVDAFPRGDEVADVDSPFERELSVIYPQTMGAEDSLSEIDITNYVKNSIKNDKLEIAFKLSSDADIGPNIATSGYSDSAYRPCLKILTGEATDTDAGTLRKAELTDAVYVSSKFADSTGEELSGENSDLLVDGDDEAYLKFALNENAIFDTVYNARLSICKKGGENGKNFKVYIVNNNQWSGNNISYQTRPRGEQYPAGEFTAKEDGRINFDVTQAVCEARELGISEITFRIVADDEAETVSFFGKGNIRYEPQLFIDATDDADISCAAEAAINALGVNSSNFVTMGLLDSYTDDNGNTAKIRWKEYNGDGDEITNHHLLSSGEIKRPKWFEENASVIAQARIQSGNYVTNRRYYLVIPSETAPDYSRFSFGNYIDIGNSQSEEMQKFDGVNIGGTRRRWTSGRVFDYRVPDADGVMVLNFSCIDDADNYITLKLWEGDKTPYRDFKLTLCGDGNGESIVLSTPDKSAADSQGFVYATYALPREFTTGRDYVSLRLEFARADGEFSETALESRGIYAAYLTQRPFFEPEQFAKQGEKAISEPSFKDGAIRKFIENLKSLSIPIMPKYEIEDSVEMEEAEPLNRIEYDVNTGTVLVSGDELNIAVSINYDLKRAVIYQKLDYYDRYCAGCPVTIEDDVIIVDYGDYKLALNTSDSTSKQFPYWKAEMSGAYKDIVGDKYYDFSEERQTTDESVIPEGAQVYDGKKIFIEPNSAVLLMHIADPLQSSDWRVSKINNSNVTELKFEDNEKIDNITVRAIGGISGDAEKISVMAAIYEDEKIISAYQKEIEIRDSLDIYNVDISKSKLYMKNGRALKIFIFDENEDLTELEPKLEKM